jgi:P pilus assembly chaperone PapD
MTSKARLIVRVGAAFFAAVAGSMAPAFAQVSLEVSPLRVELQAEPGGSTTQAITLTNAGAEPVRVRARLSDWDLTREGTPQFEGAPVGGLFSATSWLRIAPPEQVIEPGKDAIVRFTLAVPAGTQPAGYRTSVLFEFSGASDDAAGRGRNVQFRSRIATLIYVNVGQPPAAVELIDLSLRPAEKELKAIAVLKNASKRTVRTRGSLVVYDASGRTVHTAAVPDVPVLPESEREVAITITDSTMTPLPAGEYRVEVKIDAGMPALIVGETALKVSR